MRARHARQIRQGIMMFRLNWPRFSYRNAGNGGGTLLPWLALKTWAELEHRSEAKNG